MLPEAQPAHHAEAVEPLMVQPELLDEVALLVGEIALHQELSGEVVVASERGGLARGTCGFFGGAP